MNVNDTLRGMELCALAYKEVQPQFPGMTLEVIDDENGVQCYLRRAGRYPVHHLPGFQFSQRLEGGSHLFQNLYPL